MLFFSLSLSFSQFTGLWPWRIDTCGEGWREEGIGGSVEGVWCWAAGALPLLLISRLNGASRWASAEHGGSATLLFTPVAKPGLLRVK